MNMFNLLGLVKKPIGLPDAELTTNGALQTVLHFIFGLAGALALLMIAIAALRYVMSRGDAENVKKAKNTILYALVGLGIAMSAYAIVTFVFRQVT